MGEARETSDRDRERIHVVASLGLPTLSLSTSPFLHPAMAVQAQYPSHAFFHNRYFPLSSLLSVSCTLTSEPRRNEMDTKNTEYGFLDSSPLFFPPHPPNGGIISNLSFSLYYFLSVNIFFCREPEQQQEER